MAKWKIIYKDQTEDILEADIVQLDQTGNFLVFAKTSGVQIPMGAEKGAMQAAKLVRFVNKDVIVEAFDVKESGRVSELLAN